MPNFQKISGGIQLTLLPTSSRPGTPVNGMIYYDSTLDQFQKYEAGAWTSFASGSVASGTALRLALYPTSSASVGDTAIQNSQNINVAVATQATRSAAILYTIPNPGDAVTATSFVLTEGTQSINGNKTFGNDVVITGNLTVNGTTTTINTTNTNITDALITLNKGGASTSGSNTGFEIEENSSITGYFKTTSARTGFQMKAPATAGIATFITPAASWSYTLPEKTGTFMLQVIDDVAPQLGGNLDVNGKAIVSASNGAIQFAPQGTGRVQKAKAGALTRYADEVYIDAVALTATTTAVSSALTFDTTIYKAQEVEFTIVEATSNKRRIGKLLIVVDGASGVAATTISLVETSNETADIGVSWAAAMNSNNCELSYTTTGSNAKTMQCIVKRFLA